MDEKIRAEFFSRRFSLMQGTILGQIDEELDDDVFAKLITAHFHTVKNKTFLDTCIIKNMKEMGSFLKI